MSEARKKPSKKPAKKATKKQSSVKILHDVTAPGKTPATTTSRPVIVGHRTTIKQDPMVIAEAAEAMTEKDLQTQTEELLRPLVDDGFAPTAPKLAKGKDVQPDNPDVVAASVSQEISDDEPSFALPANDEADTIDGATASEPAAHEAGGAKKSQKGVRAETETTETPSEPSETDKPEHRSEPETPHNEDYPVKDSQEAEHTGVAAEAKKIAPDTTSESESSGKKADQATHQEHDAAVKTLAEEVTKKQEASQDQAELEARQKHVQQLVDSKKYFVPIGQVSRRRSNRRAIIILLLVIILSVVGLNFAVDAELVEIGVDPYTNIL